MKELQHAGFMVFVATNEEGKKQFRVRMTAYAKPILLTGWAFDEGNEGIDTEYRSEWVDDPGVVGVADEIVRVAKLALDALADGGFLTEDRDDA